MKKILLLTLIYISFFLLTGFEYSKPENQGQRIIINQTDPIPGPLLKTGQSIYLTGQVDGDVLLFGTEILVDATINGDLIIIGAKVDIRGQVSQDLRVAAGQLTVDATIGDDASLIAGQITLSPSSQINNSLLAAAGYISLDAPVKNNLSLLANQIRFDGQAQKNATLRAETVTIQSNAFINGDLTITSTQQPTIDPQAVINGELIQNQPPPSPTQPLIKKLPFKGSLIQRISALVILEKTALLALDIFLGLLLITLLPKLTHSLTKTALRETSLALGWGFIILILIPILGTLLLISLIGIPIAVLLFMLYGFSFYAAKLIISLTLGAKLLNDPRLNHPFKNFILGVFIISILRLIPLVGWLTYFVFILVGLGSIVLQQKTAFRKLMKINNKK